MTSDGDFWAFSLRLYAEPGVPAATLHLQDECGADVDIVLYVLWRAGLGQCVDAASLDAAIEAVAEWHRHVVRPLRAVRQVLKRRLADVSDDAAAALRTRVAAEELEAERLQHQALARHSGPAGGPPADPCPALARYAERLGTRFPAEALARLIAAARAVSGAPDPSSA
jgi:uncharacterized protein (TIGR02444 family)